MQGIRKSLFCFLMILVFCCAYPATQIHTGKPKAEVWQKILSLEGQDLTQLDNQTHGEVFHFLQSADPTERDLPPPRVGKDVPPFHSLRYIWKMEKPDAPTRYIVVGASPLFIIPGDSRAEAFVFDEAGNLLSYSEFSLGWREQ